MLLLLASEVAAATTVSVDDPRDWLDYLAVWSGLIGALLAAFAVGYAAWQARETKRALIRERRLEFELELLAEMRRQMSITQFQHLSGYVGALIFDAEDETDIPLVRASVGTKAGPIGKQRREEFAARSKPFASLTPSAEWVKAAQDEIDSAIQRRLSV